MMKITSFLLSFALTFGAALSFAYAECPTWEELLAEESVIEVNTARRATMFVSYLNPSQLGVCFLGEEYYNKFVVRLVKEHPDRHFFWIGGPHSMDLVDTASRTSMLHEGKEFYFDLATMLEGPRSFPGIEIEFLLSFEGEIDFFEPVTVFFTPFMGGTSSKEYWLPEKYLPE